jgi:hypothetical protein
MSLELLRTMNRSLLAMDEKAYFLKVVISTNTIFIKSNTDPKNTIIKFFRPFIIRKPRSPEKLGPIATRGRIAGTDSDKNIPIYSIISICILFFRYVCLKRKYITRAQCCKTFYSRDLRMFSMS